MSARTGGSSCACSASLLRGEHCSYRHLHMYAELAQQHLSTAQVLAQAPRCIRWAGTASSEHGTGSTLGLARYPTLTGCLQAAGNTCCWCWGECVRLQGCWVPMGRRAARQGSVCQRSTGALTRDMQGGGPLTNLNNAEGAAGCGVGDDPCG